MANESLVDRCSDLLRDLWADLDGYPIEDDFDPERSKGIAALLRSPIKSYRYVLPTHLLAKVADATIDATCVQASRPDKTGNFDARSIASRVLSPFERAHGSMLGGSGDPYVNNPLRVPEVSARYRAQQLNKDHWDSLAAILDHVESVNDPAFSLTVLRQVLQEMRRLREEQTIAYPVPHRPAFESTLDAVFRFLEPRTGGGRLQCIVVAAFRAMKERWGIYDEVSSAPVTAPDAQADRPADIECKRGGETVLAAEVKDRTLTLELLEDKIKSARLANVSELIFLIRATPLVAGSDVSDRASREFAAGQSVYLLAVEPFLQHLLAILGTEGRRLFLSEVGKALEELRVDFSDRKKWADLLTKL